MTLIDALTDQPVCGAPITVDKSTSPTQTRTTGADGKVVFAGLEPSAIAASDPKYKYRLTVGLDDPWVTHPDSMPAVAQQHLAASQTWTTTLKVFKRATIPVNLRDAGTAQLVTERTEVAVTTPGPDVLSDGLDGNTGPFMFAALTGKPIKPSASNFPVDAQADCYRSQTAARPVPTGYPSNTTEVFDFAMKRVPSGYLDVTVRSTRTGNPVIPGAQVQVSGGQGNLPPRVRTADGNGFARFCLDPSGSANYVLSVAQPGYGAGAILAAVVQNQTTPVTVYLDPSSNTGTVRLTAARPTRRCASGGRRNLVASQNTNARAGPTSPAWPPGTTWRTSPPASRAATRPGAPARWSRRTAAAAAPIRCRMRRGSSTAAAAPPNPARARASPSSSC